LNQKITKVDPVTFLRNEFDKDEINQEIEERKKLLKGEAKKYESENILGLQKFTDFLSNSISNHDIFIKFPDDKRFPYNIGGLSSHLLLAAGIIQFILLYFVATKKIEDEDQFEKIIKLLGIDFEIDSKENLCLLGRFIGLIHEITKSNISNQNDTSAEFSEEILRILRVPKEWVKFVSKVIKEYNKESPTTLFSEIVQLSDWLSTSERISFTNLYFMNAYFKKYKGINVPFVNKDEFFNGIRKYNEDLNLNDIKSLKNSFNNLLTDFKSFMVKSEGKEYPYFFRPDSCDYIINKTNEITQKGDFPLNEPCLTFLDLSFKSKQTFIFQGSHLWRIIGGSLLIQLFEEIFYDTFSTICCPELIVSKGGGELLGMLPISVEDKEIREELEAQIKRKLNKFQNKLQNKNINIDKVTKKLLEHVRIKYSNDYRVSLYELRFGRDLEDEPNLSYDYSYYYDNYIKGNSKDKENVLSYFLHPNTINKIIHNHNFTSLSDLVENWELPEIEFFLAFQERKSFGEIIGNFYDSVIEKDSLPKHLEVREPKDKQICLECQEIFENINDSESSEICDICILCRTLTDKMQELREFPTQRLFNKIKKIIAADGNIELNNKNLLDLDKISTPSIESENSNYMGFVRLDGNNFGMIKSYMKTFSSYRSFSRFIAKKTEQILIEACKKTIKDWSNSLKAKRIGRNLFTPLFRFFIVGGDDISLALHSELTFPFIQNFFEKIRENYGYKITEDKLEDKIGMDPVTIYPTGFSGGVIITHTNIPFYILNNCANYLEHKAKEFIKPKYSDPTSEKIYGGCLNSIAPIYIPQGITKNYIQQYYEHKLIPKFTVCDFPLDDESYELFLNRIKKILSNGISQRSFKSIYRGGLNLLPLELNMQLYYKAGREYNDKKSNNDLADFWSKLSRDLSEQIKKYNNNIKNYKEKYNNKILIRWFEPIELSRFYV